MIYWVLLYSVWAGLILPDKTTPIRLQWNNRNYNSRYFFSFWIPSDIDSEASLTIDFPQQYLSDLGLSACESSRMTDQVSVSIPCSVQSNKLTLFVSSIKAGAHEFSIENIKNPESAGSTGVFKIRTLKSNSIIDENALFPAIGIALDPDTLNVELTVEGALVAKYSPIYKFKIKPNSYIPKHSWIRLIFPDGFSFYNPSCFVEEWNEWISVTPDSDDNMLLFDPLSEHILAEEKTFNVYGIYNPPISGESEDIVVEILRENTFTVLASYQSVSSPEFVAGTISKVQITGSPLMTNSPGMYSFSFLPYNEIPEGGKVSVKFPSGYNGLISETCLSIQGLKPVAGSNTVSCEVNTDTVTFGNFQTVSGQTIKLKVKANNPSVSGNTGSFSISTYNKDSVLIDSNSNSGHVTISSVQYPEGFSVEMLKPKTDNPIGSYAPIDFFVHPRNYLPCTVPPSTYLDIKIDCPSVIVAGTGDVSCTFGKDQLIASYCNFDPSLSPPQIQIKTPTTGVDCCPLAIKVTTAGVPSGFTIPIADYGQYKFILRLYDDSGTQLEEAEYIFGTNPDAFGSIDFWYLHNTRDAWNVLKFDIKNSVDIPQDGMIEWEFQTFNNSFPRDLGWGLQSYETQEFSCTYDSSFPDASPSSIYCEITAGTTKDSVFVRMKGFNAVVSKGTSRWIHLSNVKNAEYAGFVPKFVMRTKDVDGVVLNEASFELPALVELPDPLTGSVAGSSYIIDNGATEMDISLDMSDDLVGLAWVYIVFPHGYKWDHPDAQGDSIASCSSNTLLGGTSYYEEFTQPQAAGILYTQTTADSVSTPFITCFKADYQSLWIQNPVIKAYVVVNQVVRDYYEISHGQVNYAATINFDGAMEKHSAFDKNTTNLWRLKFQQNHRITDGGTIQVLLPTQYFESVDTGCYKIVNSGIRCKGQNDFNSQFHRMVLYGVTDHSPLVDLPETYQLDPVNIFEVWFYATTGFTAGIAKVEIFSQDEDDGIDKRIDQKIISLTISDNLYPFYISMDSLHTNYIEAYGSESWNSFEEWGPIKIIIKPNQIFPETNTLYNTLITITFPCVKGIKYFTKHPDGLIQCRMNTLQDFLEEGYFGRLCTFIEGTSGTPCTADQVTFYTPEELRVDPTLAAPYDYYEIELSTIGVTNPLQNGFLYPEKSDYYRFIVNLNKNSGANIEQAEPFLYVMEDRFTYLYTTSEHKRNGDANIMMFNFKLQHDIFDSNDTVTPGCLLLEFPFDYSGTGAGWLSDLGTGIPDGGKIDCLQDLAVHTVPSLYNDPVYDEARVECYLKYGYYDYTTIVVKNIKYPNAGSMFNLYFGGIINPTKNLYDFPIRIRTVYENITDYTDPTWVTLDTKVNTYVETGFNIGGGDGKPTKWIQDDYSRVVDPVRYIPGMDKLTVSFNIENIGDIASGTWIWVQVPIGFKLPDWKNPDISLKVVNGSMNGFYDTTFTCNPAQPIYTWPETRLFKFTNCITLTEKNYTSKIITKVYSPNRVEFYPITLETWPDNPITSKTWVVATRRSSLSRTNIFPTDYTTTSTSCTVTYAGTTEYGYYSTSEVYNFQFECPSAINVGGEYIIYFPLEFADGTISASSCVFSTGSYINTGMGASCSLFRGIELHIDGFSSTVPANSFVYVNITVTNPPQGSKTNPYTASRFVIATYNSTDLFKGSFQVIDRTDPAGTAWFTDPANPSLEPPKITNQQTASIIYHEPFALPSSGIGPIQLQISSPNKIVKKSGYIVLSTFETISLATNGEIRCVWKVSGNEYLADDCIFELNTSSVLPTKIYMYAPTSYNVVINTLYDLFITTVFADGGEEGFVFGSGLVRYGFLVEVYANGGTSASSIKCAEKRYLELVGDMFPYVSIKADQWTFGEFTRIRISFRVSSTISSTDRLVVEFPTSSSGYFADDLGLGLSNNEQIPCLGSGSLTPTISCYLFVGSSSLSTPVKVIISGFSSIASGSTYTIEFPKIINPTTGGDDVQISIVLYALDMTNGWPGTQIHYRDVEKLYRIKTNSISTQTASSQPSVSGSDFTFTLSPISTISGDYLAVVIHSAASLASSSPVCKDGSTVLTCTYYSGSNTVIIDMNGGESSVTIEAIVNPLPSEDYLDFSIYHWSLNEAKVNLYFAALAQLPISVSYAGKVNLYTGDVMEYQITFMPTKIVPSTGSVVVEFPSEFPSLPDGSCYNVHDGSVSFMTGAYSCVISSLTATISGFNELKTGENVVVRILAENPASTLTTSAGFKVTTYSTTSGSASDLIETNTDTNTLTFISATTPTFYEISRQYKKPVYITADADAYAPIKIKISDFGSLLANTGKILIKLTGFGTIPAGSQVVCLFGSKRTRCSVSSNIVTVYAPEDSLWSTYPVILTLTSTNADNIDVVGFQHPSTAGQYRIEVKGDSSNDGTFETFAVDYIQVFPSSYFTTFSITPSHTTAEAYNLFQVDLTTKTLIPASGYIRIYFPTTDTWGNTLFDNDLGTGLSHGEKIPCQEYPGSSGLSSLSSLNPLTCKLYLGNSDISKPATVELTNFQAISAGTSISFVIWKVKNPSNTLSDSIHIEMFGLSLDDSYSELDFFYFNYVMTVTDPISSDPGTPSSPNDTPTVTSGLVGTVITIDIPLMDNSKAIVSGTVYLLEFDSQIDLTGVSVSECTVFETLNIIQYNSPPSGSAGSYPSLSVTTAVKMMHQWSEPVIKCYQWSNSISQRDGNSYTGIADLTLATFTSISSSFPLVFNKYMSSSTTIQNSIVIPAQGTLILTFPADYTVLSNDCEVSGLSILTNYKCSVSGQKATITFYESLPSGSTLIVTSDLQALTDTTDILQIDSYYDSASTIPIETSSNTPTSTASSPNWPIYFHAPPQSITTSTSIKSSLSKILFKLKPTSTISNLASDYFTVTMATAFSGKNTNAELYCTVDNNRVPCEETVANKEFKVYASSLYSISSGSWHEVLIFTQFANGDLNGFIQPSSMTSNTMTVELSDGTDAETRTISVSDSLLKHFQVSYLHTTASEPNIFSFILKTTADTDGSTDSVVIEFPLKDFDDNELFEFDLGTGKSSGENFYIDNYSFTGSFYCRLFHGDADNNLPARVEITGYDSITAGTSITFDIARVNNPVTSGYDVQVSLRAYIYTGSTIREEKTVDYIFSPFGYSTSTSCSGSEPTLSDYTTSATSSLTFGCCATTDLKASDYLILEIPSDYPFPSSASINAASAFTSIYKKLESANWIILKSSSTVACNSGSPTSILDNFVNPSYEILANVLEFKGYIISSKSPIGTTTIYKPTMIDKFLYTKVSSAISPVATGSVTPSMSLSLIETEENVQSIVEATISYTGTFPSAGYFTLEVSVSTDPYYFTVTQGITGEFSFTLSSNTYTVSEFSSISSSILINVPVKNPESGSSITLVFSAYSSNGSLKGSVSKTTSSTTSSGFANLSTKSHILRYLSYDSSTDFISLHIDLLISTSFSSATYVIINFPTNIDATAYSATTSDTLSVFDGSTCTSPCLAAEWTSGETVQYSFSSLSSGSHYLEISGYPNLKINTNAKGLNLVKLWISGSSTPTSGDYFYTFYMNSPSSGGTLNSVSQYGSGVSEKSFIQIDVTPTASPDYFFIEFFQDFTTSNGFSSDLGTGLTDGEFVSGMTEYSGTDKENCVLRISTTSKVSGIQCQSASTTIGSHLLYLANILNPTSSTTGYFHIYSLTYSTSPTDIHSFVLSSLTISSSSATTLSASPSLSSSIVQESSTWTLTTLIDNTYSIAGDMVLIEFSNNLDSFQLASATPTAGITSLKLFTKKPAIWLELSAIPPNTISFTMNNPIYSSTFSLNCMTFSGATLTQTASTTTLVIAPGTISTISSLTPHSPTVPFTVAFDLSFTLQHLVPEGGKIEIQLTKSYYNSVSCSACTSSLTDQDYQNRVTYSITSSSSLWKITITKFASVSAGSYSIGQIRLECLTNGASTIELITYASSLKIDSGSISLTVNSEATTLPGIVLLPRLSLMTGPQVPTASSVSDINLLFTPYSSLDPVSSSYIVLRFTDNTVWVQKDSAATLKCLINGNLAHSCSRSTTDLTITHSVKLDSGTLYTIKITANNAQYDGLNSPTSSSWNLVTIKTYIGVPLTDEGSVNIPITSTPTSLISDLFVQSEGSSSLLHVQFKLNNAVPGNTGYLTIEFPVYDLEMSQELFEAQLGDSEVDGTYFPCELFSSGPLFVPISGVTCMLDKGYYSTSISRSSRVVVNTNAGLTSGTSYVLGFPGIIVPSSARGADLVFYSYSASTALLDYQVLRHVYYVNSVTSITSVTADFPSLSDSKLMKTSVTYSFTLQPSFPIQTYDVLLFKANKDHISISSSTTSTFSYNFIYLYPTSGWVLLQPSSTIGTTSTITIDLSEIVNPSYISSDSSDYTFSVLHINSLTSVRDKGIIKYEYKFSNNIPSPAYDLGIITITDYGCLTCSSTIIDSSQELMFYVTFEYDLDLPASSVIQVQLPDSTDEFQSIAFNCEAYSSGFTSEANCEKTDTLLLSISNFATYSLGSSIQVIFKALGPAISITTGSGSVRVYYDGDLDKDIGSSSTLSFSVNGPDSAPNGNALIEFSQSSPTLSTRTGSYSSFTISFTPSSTVSKATGSFTVDLSLTPINSKYLCKFIDPSNNNIEYISSSCTYSGTVFTVLSPINTDITSGNNWELELFTYGQSSDNGLLYPSAGQTLIKTTVGSEIFEYYYEVLPAAATTVKVYPYCHTVEFVNLFEVIIETNVGDYSANDRIEIEFEPSLFLSDLGTGTTDGEEIDCSSTYSSTSNVYCTLQAGIDSSYSYRPLGPRVRLHEQSADTGKNTIYLANIYNPADEDLNIKIRVRVFTLSGSTETTIIDEMIFHTMGTTLSYVSELTDDSYLNSIGDLAVGVVTDFQVSTDISSSTVSSTDHVFWRFAYILTSTSIVITEASGGNDQLYQIYLQKSTILEGLIVSYPPSSDSYTGDIEWDFTDFENPPYKPLNDPILIVDVVIDGFHSYSITFSSNPLNHEPGDVTISQFYVAGNSNIMIEGYLGGYADIDVKFSVPYDVGTNLVISIDFGTNFALDSFCQVLGSSISPIYGDWVDCRSSSSSFILSNINGYTANSEVQVRGWVNLPTTSGPHSISIVFYYEYSTLVSYETTYSLTIQSIPALTNYYMGPYIHYSPKIPVYGGETAWLYFAVTIPSTLSKNQGFLSFTFEISSFTIPSLLTCDWDDGSTVWQSSSCTSSTDSTTSLTTVQVLCPEYNDITSGDWLLTLRGLSGSSNEGFTFPTTTYKDFQVDIQYSADGTTISSLGISKIKNPKEAFAEASIFTYNVLMDSEIIFEFEFLTNTDVTKGIPQSGGKSYILIYFPTVVNGTDCFSDDIGSGLADEELMDCFNLANLDNLYTHLILGDQSGSTAGLFYINNYTNDLTSGTKNQFYLPMLKNPQSPDAIINFVVEVWEEINTISELKIYQEFNYCYDSKNEAVSTQSSTISYSSEIIHALADIGFTVLLTNTISGTASDEKIVWKLTETSPTWTSNYCSLYTCQPILNKHLLIMTPSAQILDQDTLTLNDVPNPDDPNLSQSWTIYVFKGNIIQDKLTYNISSFNIPEPSGSASVTWRLPDENVANPLTSRHDRYLFRFRPTTSIPLGGSFTITFPTLKVDTTKAYSVDNACNPLHGIYGNNGKCSITNATLITCTGFQQWDPWMPEIHIECYATNPSSQGELNNFEIDTYDASGNVLFSKPIVPDFEIVDAPTELFDFRMGWPERTRATACENRNYADLFIKIVTVRPFYGTGNVVRVYLPTGVTLTTDTDGTTYLECAWRNRFNKTPPEFCATGNDGIQTFINVGITDQQGLKPNSEYTIHIYTRDTSGGLYYTGVELPSFPEWESWYILATTGSRGDGAKVKNEVCPVPFTSLALRPYSYTVRKWNIFDLSFTPSRDVPIGGGVVIEMRTTNELDQIFDLDMGLNMDPLVMYKDIGCIVLSGFGSPAAGTIKCKVYKSILIGKFSPAYVYITGHTSVISSSSSHSIRIVKIKNPVQSFSEILNEQLRVHFTIWTYRSTSSVFGTDYARYNLDTILNIFDYSGTKIMVEPNPAIFTDELLSNPIDTIFTVYTLPLYTSIELSVAVDTDTSFIMYEFDPAFTLPTTGSSNIECNSVVTNCDIYAESLWIVWREDSSANSNYEMEFLDSGSSVFKTPNYEAESYKLSAYVINQGIWAEEHTFVNMSKVNKVTPTVVISHRLTTLHRKTYDIWTVSITPAKGSSRVIRIDIWFPAEFMWLDSECTVTGLTKATTNIYPVSCVSDCDQEECTNHITITNFDPTSTTGTIELTIGAMNPATELTTSKFEVYYYSDLEDRTQIVEYWTGNTLTIDEIIYPFDYWVEWPTVSIYERELDEGEYGEIWFRFRSRVGLSSTTGWYKIILPDEFDIAPSADPKCTIFHTDMPFDNYPDRWDENRTHYVVSQCLYSNKVISVKFTGNVLREFYGIKTGICTYLVLTTYSSPVDGSEGYKSAKTSGCYSIQFYAMEGSDVVESAVSDLCILGSQAEDLEVILSTIDAGTNAIMKIEFTTQSDLPNGYFYLDGTSQGDQTTILVEFESYESFAYDLDGQYSDDMFVYCNGIQGIKTPDGESLLCKLTLGIVNLPPPALQHDPATLEISNFEAISKDTFISIHLPIIKTPETVGNTPQVTVGVYKVNYEGQLTWLIGKETKSLSPVLTPLYPTEQGVCINSNSSCSITNTNIRTRTNIILYFTASSTLDPGSIIVIHFPEQYSDIPTDSVTASIKKNPLTDKTTETYIIDGIEVVTYPEAKMVALWIPNSIYAGEDVDIKLMNFTNPSYIDTEGYIKYYSINTDHQVQDNFTTGNIFDIFEFTPLKFATNPSATSSVFAKGTDVNLNLNCSLPIDLESGSKILIKIPDVYPSISNINPPVTCQVNFEAICELSDGKIQIKDYSGISENTQIIISIKGLLNPTSSEIIPQSDEGLTITALDASDNIIAYSEFPSYRIVNSNPVLKLQVNIIPEFSQASVPSTYTFELSTTQSVPSGGDIKITFPEEYPDLPTTERCLTSGILQAINSCEISERTMTINTFSHIKRFVKFNVTLGWVVNPSAAGNTSAFEISTYFGGEQLDTLDADDARNRVLIEDIPGALTVFSSRLLPKNEGMPAGYTFVVENPVSINKTDAISFHVQFPHEYAYHLVAATDDIYCESTPEHSSCYIKYPRTVVFETLSPFSESQTMTFNIYSIVNPVEGTTNKFNLLLVNKLSDSVLYFDQSVQFQILSLPSVLNMSSIESSSLTTHTFAEYLFRFTLNDTSIKQNGGVYIDWPGNFYTLVAGNYECSYANTSDPRLLNPTCNFEKSLGFRVTSTIMSQEITSDSQELFLVFQEVPTLQENGNSGNFIIMFLDNDQELISVRSYPNLTPYPNLDFVNKGYRIFINTTEIFVYQGSYSNAIVLTVEKATYNFLSIKPVAGNKEIGIQPEEMVWRYAWDIDKSFRVFVPNTVPVGRYLLSWVKTEVNTDSEDREYKPLINMYITVLAPTGNLPIVCEDISYIPISGSSLPVKVWIPIPTYELLNISISTSNPYQPDYVKIDPPYVTLTDSESHSYFTISIISGAVSGSISLTASGPASTTYYIERPLIPFQTLPSDSSPPVIYSIRPTGLTRTTIKVLIKSSELVQIFYQITRKGTQIPTVSMLVNNELMWSDCENYFGTLWTDINLGYGVISATGLTDATDYIVYVAAKDRAGRLTEGVSVLEFQTLPTYLPAKFRVYVTKVSSVSDIIKGTAQALALPQNFLIHTGIDPELGITRRLTTDSEQKLYYELTLFINRTLDSEKPTTYIKNLDHSPEKLVKYIPFYDPEMTVSDSATEYSYQKAQFHGEYQVWSDGYGNVYTELSITTDGTVYGIILASNKLSPSSIQIKSGLDGHNRKLKSGRYTSAQMIQDTKTEFNFTGLPVQNQFTLYFTAENNLPGNPELLPDNEILKITTWVESEPENSFKFKFKYLNSSPLLSLTFIYLILI